ncbi:hypothetical protein [Streptomyces klenkii]
MSELSAHPRPVREGRYELHATFGIGIWVLTAAPAVDHGAPLVTAPPQGPAHQEWIVRRTGQAPDSPYVILSAARPNAGAVTADDKLWANGLPLVQWTKVTFLSEIGNPLVKIQSEGNRFWLPPAPYKQVQVIKDGQQRYEYWGCDTRARSARSREGAPGKGAPAPPTRRRR